MSVVAKNGVALGSVEKVVRNAISTLLRDFKTNDREETAWARDLLGRTNLTPECMASRIEPMILRHCPEVPDEYFPFVLEVLSAAVRLARLDRARGTSTPQRVNRCETANFSA